MNSPLTEYLTTVADDLRPVVTELRRIILATVPAAEESLKWGNLCYGVGTGMLYLSSHRGHVNFGLVFGARIQDDTGRIEGTGKSLRHVKFRSVDEVQQLHDRLVDWCRQSADLARAAADGRKTQAKSRPATASPRPSRSRSRGSR